MNSENRLLRSVYNIYFETRSLPESILRLVTDITIDESIDGFDQCTIRFNDPDYSLLSDSYFINDTYVYVVMTVYPRTSSKPKSFVFEGCISAIDLNFPESGVPQISIICVDFYSHWLNRNDKSFTLSGSSFSKGYVTNADIVKYIITKRWSGLNYPKIEGNGYYFRREDSISQSKTTDIAFLQSLAKKEVYPFFCKFIRANDGKTYLHYRKKGILGTPVASLYYKYGDFSIVSFSPQINKETVKANIKEANVNLKNKLVMSGVANNQVTYQETIGTGVKTLGSLTASSSVVYKENDEATQDATKLFVDIQYNTLKGEVSVIPTLKVLDIHVDNTVNLYGLGSNLSGKYYVTGVKRTINSNGYSQSISVIKNGFGDTLVSSSSNKKSSYWDCGYNINSIVKITGKNPVYANEFDGIKLSKEEKSWKYRVTDKSLDGTRLQIQPTDGTKPQEKKWIYIQYVTKVK